MEHIKQNASGLYLEIQKIGCFFRSALLIAENKTGRSLSLEQINSLWDYAKITGYIDENNNVVNSAEIANRALKMLGDRGKFVEVAIFKNGKMGWYANVPECHRRTNAFIQKISQNGPNKTHFRVIDRCGNLIEDPHEPKITMQGIFYTICYRYDGGQNGRFTIERKIPE